MDRGLPDAPYGVVRAAAGRVSWRKCFPQAAPRASCSTAKHMESGRRHYTLVRGRVLLVQIRSSAIRLRLWRGLSGPLRPAHRELNQF